MLGNDYPVEQALRISHCSNKEKGHGCMGECKITPTGLELSCKLCGTDSRPLISPIEREAEAKAKRILAAAGLAYDKLAPLAQRAVLDAMARDYCKGCGREHFHFADYLACSCGWSFTEHRGWRPTVDRLAPELAARPDGDPF